MEHSNIPLENQTETLEQLNARYAQALFPLTVTFGIFTCIGFLGNLVTLLVVTLSNEYRRNNFKVFALTLGIIDLITSVTLIPAEIIKHRHYFSFDNASLCKVKCFFNVFGASASCLAFLVISIDRHRKVVQPLRKQMPPRLAFWILFVVAFVVPILLAIPGTVMCGVHISNKTNIYGGTTQIHLCETEQKYSISVWRPIYKYVLSTLLLGVSLVIVILFTFVMKEAVKQIKSITNQRSSCSRSDIYMQPVQSNSSKNQLCSKKYDEQRFTVQDSDPNNMDYKQKNFSKHFRWRSIRSQAPLGQGFPTKSIVWFILIIVFVVTYMTNNVLSLNISAVSAMGPFEFATFSFFYRFYFFNHIVNPIVYAIFLKSFRESCWTLLLTLKARLVKCLS